MILLSLILTIAPIKVAQPPTIVKGYVYIDNVKEQPDQVSLMLPEEMRYATTYSDGRYIIMFNNANPGDTGEFLIINNGLSYIPAETLTIQQDVYLYEIDLHIQTEDADSDNNEQENIPPIANAGGPYYEIANNQMKFDGSESIDPDGTIIVYSWDFGDSFKGSGIKPSHSYQQIGKYQIKLTVTDNEGLTDISYSYAYITATPNIPPTNLTITGIKNGTILRSYGYTLWAKDLDNETIQYIIDWDDGTQTNSNFLPNGTIFIVNHSYYEPGIFDIIATAMDENSLYSEAVQLTVLIDARYIETIGYMIDYTNDGVYDLFHANVTEIETPVEVNNGEYVIDFDNDGAYDYKYDPITYDLMKYTSEDITGEQQNQVAFTLILEPEIILAIVVVILVIVIISYLAIRRKYKPKKQKEMQTENKSKPKKTETDKRKSETKIKTKEIGNIEKEIDELINKKLN
ncbi:MAG: hypothetical protein BV457_03150 [Thermoplasmata archaeon M9B1D]|nr:MAG: hypothetical protein BV457_03150 [Thermoplasmata archaeon M9B1D]